MKSKTNLKTTKKPSSQIKKLRKVHEITEYEIVHNGLRILYVHRPHTGVITSDIVYKVGARDEGRGETGIAHMLEHMLFKPTKQDIARKTDSGAMLFEREVGIVLNANTWKDRTSYFFSYPKDHFARALRIEAERMRDVVLTNESFMPERTNVLSEFDMYAGSEEFPLSVQMIGTALQSHPYGHETIGYREDIEDYTIEKLEAFYKKYYAPNNAILIIVGDVTEKDMLTQVQKYFAQLKPSRTLQPREIIREPLQEGMRMVTVKRPSSQNLLALGVLHEGLPQKGWFETMVAFELLAGGDDSVLHKALVDTGVATSVHASLEPTYDKNLGMVVISLSPGKKHNDVYCIVRTVLDGLTTRDITPYLKKVIARSLTHEFTGRESSLGYVAELVEYVSAGAWEHFFKTEEMLRSITAKDIYTRIKNAFSEDVLTIGHFVGTK